MVFRPDKDVLNEHAKFNKFDKYKQKPGVMGVASTPQIDTDSPDKKGSPTLDLTTARMLSGNSVLTQDELTQLKKSTKTKEDI